MEISNDKLTFGPIRCEKLLDSNIINDGSTSWIILHARIPKHHARLLLLRLKRPSVRIPAVHIIHRLQINGLRRPRRHRRHVQRLELCASASRAEGDGVDGALFHLDVLADLGVIAEPHGMRAAGHDEDHRALFLIRLDELDGTVGFPAGDCRGCIVVGETGWWRGFEITVS